MPSRSALPKRKILVVSHDIGGAQAVYPVVPKLRGKANLQVDVIAGGFAQKVFTRLRAENASEDWSDTRIDEYLGRNRPDLLLSSTSWKSRLEQGFRNRAYATGIPSIVVIDFWSNYRNRWHDATYRFEDGPDHVCVMDARTAEAVHKEGYPMAMIHVTGQPHLERCYQKAVAHQPRSKSAQGITVLFLTISLSALGLNDDPVTPIRVVCEALGNLRETTKRAVSLLVRPHPHETPAPDFLPRIQQFTPPGVAVHLADRTRPLLAQLKQCNVVLGYITMGLFEARSLGKQAIAIRLADHPPELVAAMANAGIDLVPFEANSIASSLCSPGREVDMHKINTHVGASDAIVKLCRDLVDGSVDVA
ncbi:MAG: hypothetical protein JO077_11060 [Verrucomicrobia bacterium]|nr:hypothetical protein [Verrucomicrobiota bacterium]